MDDLKSLLYGPDMVSHGPDSDLIVIRTLKDIERPYMDLIRSLFGLYNVSYLTKMASYSY